MNVPRKLGDFDVKRRIGSGGMAEVFLATKRGAKGTEKRLVVKRLLPEHARSERLRQMFVHEAHVAMRLAHPNLVHFYELTDDPDGGLLLSMEYVDGADLGRILSAVKKRGARIPSAVAARIVEQAARGLHHAHEHRDEADAPLAIVHRDISPQNILVSREGVVKVGDLGVASARFVRDQTGVQPGKLRYMSPEQARGEKVDRRCDIYALGVVLHELLCLASPYGDRRGAALARAVSHGRFDHPIAENPLIPGDLAPVLAAALAADPAHRTATARELADALAQVLFERRAHIDEAAVAAALAPFLDPEGDSLSGTAPSGAGSTGGTPLGGSTSGSGASGSGTSTGDASTVPVPRRLRRASDDGAEPALFEGDSFDRYVLEGCIGRGGMADVFRARDTKLGREVALKLLRPDASGASRERLLLEAQAAATFQHPGSVIVFDVGEHDGIPFIAMELVRGRTLATYLGEDSIPLARRLRWSVAIARVLAAAHRTGLVHRDVKPSNVMVRDDGEVKVLDFGIARRHAADVGDTAGPALTAAGTILGTPGYAAPEQLRGDLVDARADQFGWAVTTYELLAGRRPWTGDGTSVLLAQMLLFPSTSLAVAMPALPAPIAAAVDRALEREPADRFATLDDAADVLAPFAEPDPASASASVPAPAGSARASLPSIPLTPSGPPLDIDEHALRPPSLPALAHPSKPASLTPRPARSLTLALAVGVLAAAAGLGATLLLGRSPSSPSQQATAAPAAPVIPSLRCEPATITGELAPAPSAAATAAATAAASAPAAVPPAEIARALGIGACARLAVELGIPWSDASSPHTLTVRASFEPDATTRIDLALADQTATASAPEPIKAVDLAVAALAARVAPPPLTPQQIHAWGAADEVGARRIARVFRLRELRIAPEIGAETVRLAETDPGSPFSHLLLLMNVAGSGAMLESARARTLERIDKLPPSRRHLVRGLLLVYPVELDRQEAARLLRESYAEAPDDHEMVSLYATLALRLGLPEAFSVTDRLLAAAPTRAIVPIENAMIRAPGDDVARAEQYARRWFDILPEARATGPVVLTLARAGKIDEARAALDFGRRLGLFATAEPLVYEGGEMDLDLLRLETARGRDLARALLGDPRPYARAQALDGLVTSHFLEGRLAEGLAAVTSGARLGIDTGYAQGAAHLLVRALAAGRWLKRRAVDPAQLEWLERAARAPDQLPRLQRAETLAEIALAPGAPRDRAATLAAIEALARESADDPWLHDDLLVQAVPLVRALRGDKAAAALYQSASRARPAARVRRAIDAALAFESLGDPASAERAYRSVSDPAVARESGLERVIAAVRLARLRAATPPPADARDSDLAARAAATADPGLLAAIERLR